MYINTYIVFCCCCCCETSRVSSSSLSVLAPPPPSSPPPISRLLLILLPALLANSLWRRKTAAWHLLRFSVVDFCYFNVLGFPFSFPLLSFPLLCSALLGIALRSYLFPLPSARIMKTSSTKVVWVILLAASPVRLFGCLVKMKGISLLFFVTPCFSVFLHFVGYSSLNVCVCVCFCRRLLFWSD